MLCSTRKVLQLMMLLMILILLIEMGTVSCWLLLVGVVLLIGVLRVLIDWLIRVDLVNAVLRDWVIRRVLMVWMIMMI